VETAFRQLKYDDCSSFSNTRKKVAAIGEIILSMIFHNICTSVLLAFGRRLFRRRRNRKLLYKVSYSDLAKTLMAVRIGKGSDHHDTKNSQGARDDHSTVRNEEHFQNSQTPFFYPVHLQALDMLHCSGNPSLAQFKMFAGSAHMHFLQLQD
jgi:hypothetical protein